LRIVPCLMSRFQRFFCFSAALKDSHLEQNEERERSCRTIYERIHRALDPNHPGHAIESSMPDATYVDIILADFLD
jgi:hypothetical protein